MNEEHLRKSRQDGIISAAQWRDIDKGQSPQPTAVRLTLKYDGDPSSARIVTDKGDVVSGVSSFCIKRKKPLGPDMLVIKVLIPRQAAPAPDELPPSSTESAGQ